jgi:hypothetical protein
LGGIKALIFKVFKKPIFRLPESRFSSYFCSLLFCFPKKRKSALYVRHAVLGSAEAGSYAPSASGGGKETSLFRLFLPNAQRGRER